MSLPLCQAWAFPTLVFVVVFDSLCSNMKWTSCTRWRISLPTVPMNSKCLGESVSFRLEEIPRRMFVCLALTLPEICSQVGCDEAQFPECKLYHAPIDTQCDTQILVCLSAPSSILPSPFSTPIKLSLVQKLLLYYRPPPGMVARRRLSGQGLVLEPMER